MHECEMHYSHPRTWKPTVCFHLLSLFNFLPRQRSQRCYTKCEMTKVTDLCPCPPPSLRKPPEGRGPVSLPQPRPQPSREDVRNLGVHRGEAQELRGTA